MRDQSIIVAFSRDHSIIVVPLKLNADNFKVGCAIDLSNCRLTPFSRKTVQ